VIAHAAKTVVINRPLESVFEFVLNGANNRLWKSSVLDVRPLGEPPYGAGSKFQQQVKGPEGPTTGDYQITEYEPNRLIAIQVMNGPARWRGQYRFRPVGAATELTCELEAEREDLHRVTAAMLETAIEQDVLALDELKAFLEKIA
jgi:hypothetical protein